MRITSRFENTSTRPTSMDTAVVHLNDGIPEATHFEAMEPYARAISLHVARAHTAVDMAEQRLMAVAGAKGRICLSSPLAEAVGLIDSQRTINTLEAKGIRTVGELLNLWRDDPAYLLSIDNLQDKSVISLFVAILRTALPKIGG